MKHVMRSTSATLGLLTALASAAAAQTATQALTFEVTAIKQMTVSVASPSLTVNAAVAGSEPTVATSSGTYAITVNNTTSKITGEISVGGAMPANLTLKANLAAIGGGTSQNDVTLGISALDLVTAISAVASSTPALTLTFSATVAAGIVASATRTVLYTIVTVLA